MVIVKCGSGGDSSRRLTLAALMQKISGQKIELNSVQDKII